MTQIISSFCLHNKIFKTKHSLFTFNSRNCKVWGKYPKMLKLKLASLADYCVPFPANMKFRAKEGYLHIQSKIAYIFKISLTGLDL